MRYVDHPPLDIVEMANGFGELFLKYIRLLTEGRSRDPAGADIVTDIESIRNGLIMNVLCHAVLGRQFAILQVCVYARNCGMDIQTMGDNNQQTTDTQFRDEFCRH